MPNGWGGLKLINAEARPSAINLPGRAAISVVVKARELGKARLIFRIQLGVGVAFVGSSGGLVREHSYVINVSDVPMEFTRFFDFSLDRGTQSRPALIPIQISGQLFNQDADAFEPSTDVTVVLRLL